jgi:sec-independent protein translocase protein TatB
MFDLGWSEILIVGAVALVVIGPKDIPRVLFELGRWIGKARGMMRELQSGFESMAREAELEEVRKQLAKTMDPNTILDIEPKPAAVQTPLAADPDPATDPEALADLADAEPLPKPAATVERLW